MVVETWNTDDGWRAQRTISKAGCIYEYQQQFTLTGAAQNIDLVIPFPFSLNRIEYFSNDATAKSFVEQVFAGSTDTTSYNAIVNVALDTNQPLSYAPSGEEGNYTQAPIRIRTAVSASTAGKLLTKKVIVRKLV